MDLQQYPPRTHEKYGSFSSIIPITQNGNKLKGNQRIGGGAGEPGFPAKTQRKWSMKYKKSINCSKPKGFSQRQHCKYGRKTRKIIRN